MRSPYSLLARRNTAGKLVYYVRFWLEGEGRYAAAKSSGQSSKAGARAWADEYLRAGNIVTQARVTFDAFAAEFFADESDYVRHQRLRGKDISTAHLRNEQAKLTNYAIPFFRGALLKNIDTPTMDRFRDMLVERGLSASSIRQTQVAVTDPAIKQ